MRHQGIAVSILSTMPSALHGPFHPALQQLPHGLIENRIAPQRQHITHGKHITHDNQHINKQHEHQPIGEAMTNRHAEDGDKKSILDARIERAYANEYDAAFAAATIKNYASLPLATILADHPSTAEALHKDHGRPRHSQADRPLCPKNATTIRTFLP